MATIEFNDEKSEWKRFEGKLVDGKLNGPGTLLLKNGSVVEGHWKNNEQNILPR